MCRHAEPDKCGEHVAASDHCRTSKRDQVHVEIADEGGKSGCPTDEGGQDTTAAISPAYDQSSCNADWYCRDQRRDNDEIPASLESPGLAPGNAEDCGDQHRTEE